MVGLKTKYDRITPVVDAVVTNIGVNPALFRAFMDILRSDSKPIGDYIQKDYGKS